MLARSLSPCQVSAAYTFSIEAASGADGVNKNKEKKKARAQKKADEALAGHGKSDKPARLTSNGGSAKPVDGLACAACGIHFQSRGLLTKHQKTCR